MSEREPDEIPDGVPMSDGPLWEGARRLTSGLSYGSTPADHTTSSPTRLRHAWRRRAGVAGLCIALLGTGILVGSNLQHAPHEPARLPPAERLTLMLQDLVPATPEEIRAACLRHARDENPKMQVMALRGLIDRELSIPAEDLEFLVHDAARKHNQATAARDAGTQRHYNGDHLYVARYAMEAAWKQAGRGDSVPPHKWLEARIEDRDEQIRHFAVSTLTALPDYTPSASAARALTNEELFGAGRLATVQAKVLADRRDATPLQLELIQMRTLAAQKPGTHGEKRRQELIKGLASPSLQVAGTAAYGLALTKEEVETTLLLANVRSFEAALDDPELAKHAKNGLLWTLTNIMNQLWLGTSGDIQAARFEPLLRRPELEVRRRVVELLGAVPGYHAGPEVRSILESEPELAKMPEGRRLLGR